MKPDQKIVFVLTLLTGMLAGASLYLLVFAPHYSADVISEKEQYAIVGEAYGGCARGPEGCPSFNLKEDGSFQFVQGERQTSGELPKDLLAAIWDDLTEQELEAARRPTERDDCRSYIDGLDFRYDVTFAGTKYRLDTCTTAFDHADRLHQDFIPAWQFMSHPTTTYPTIIEEGVSGWLIERFQGD